MTKALCIFMSDVHLSDNPSALRADEPDWFTAMQRPLREVRQLAKKLKVPIICAGDVFDHWRTPSHELVNFALEEFPNCYAAIPGQHDLPYHDYEQIERSAYWTLVEAGVLTHIEAGGYIITDQIQAWGFPWGHAPTPLPDKHEPQLVQIAVVHEYCWSGKFKYLNAPKQNHVSQFKFDGYDAVAIGDNHIPWVSGKVCNCGTFMRRHSPDLNIKPMVGVLFDDGTIKKHLLNTSDDIYCTDSEDKIEETGSIELAEFTDQLLGLKSAQDLDFAQVLRRYCTANKVNNSVVKVINEAVDKCHSQ